MNHSLAVVFSGEAGQGLQTIDDFLVKAIASKYNVFSCTDVMSRVRGGNNTVEIRISDVPCDSYKKEIDVLFLLNDHAYGRLKERITKDTLVIGGGGGWG
ncbi:MAG TPA: 2-oxoacid:acceptor oxidoreductase subunit alpha, partial [Eubacteriaceae bacterium]|nr:2-oxoacid:acceptor oxidoreductase subunit alpha [Eubacteriaceae bacterium]